MTSASVIHGLIGGALIGLAASIALLGSGRIAGICGILIRVFAADGGRGFRLAFLAGMLAVGVAVAVVAPRSIGAAVRDVPGLVVGGLLVGIGTTLANGCTSGHGVCGLARGSGRSLVAVITFMTTAALTVAIAGALA